MLDISFFLINVSFIINDRLQPNYYGEVFVKIKSYSRFIMLYAMLITTMYTGVIGYFIYFDSKTELEENIKASRLQTEIDLQETVRSEVKRVIIKIRNDINFLRRSIKNELEVRSLSGSDILDNIEFSHGKIHKHDVVEETAGILKDLKWDSGTSRYAVYKEDGTPVIGVYSRCGKKDKADENIYKYIKRSKLRDNFSGLSLENPENGKVDSVFISFTKNEEFKVYIASVSFYKKREELLQKVFIGGLGKARFGAERFGYLFAVTIDGTQLVNPTAIDYDGVNMRSINGLDGQAVFDKIKKNAISNKGEFSHYKWRDLQGKIDNKSTYSEYLEEWGWIISSGYYESLLNERMNAINNRLSMHIMGDVEQILYILAVLYLITFALSFIISKQVCRMENDKKYHFGLLEQYKSVVDKSSIVSKTNLDGIITYVNKQFEVVSGYSFEEAVGKPHNIVRHPSSSPDLFAKMWKTILGGEPWQGVVKNRSKSGANYYISATIAPIIDEKGRVVEFISTSRDITELVENKNKISELFETDQLTSLGNKVKLLTDIDIVSHPVVVIIDIDNFRVVNDLYGQHGGDACLRAVAHLMYSKFSDIAKAYRLHGDIFALLAHENFTEKMKDRISEFNVDLKTEGVATTDFKTEVSFTAGVATGEPKRVLLYAEFALQKAKKINKPVVFFDKDSEDFSDAYNDTVRALELLERVIEEDRLVPVYQPIVDLKTGKAVKYEALMRIRDRRDGSLVAPYLFLELSKKTKIYPKLTKRLAEKSFALFSGIDKQFSINLSYEDIINHNTMEFIRLKAQEYDVCNKLTVEIVETEELLNMDEVNLMLKNLKGMGIKVAIDDFGTGYSNYDYLAKIEPHYIKIDGSITSKILNEDSALELVRSIVAYADKTNRSTIAEFVENKEIVTLLLEIGVDLGQGYFYGKPEIKPEDI